MNIAFLHGVKKLTLHVIPGETDTVVLSIIVIKPLSLTVST